MGLQSVVPVPEPALLAVPLQVHVARAWKVIVLSVDCSVHVPGLLLLLPPLQVNKARARKVIVWSVECSVPVPGRPVPLKPSQRLLLLRVLEPLEVLAWLRARLAAGLPSWLEEFQPRIPSELLHCMHLQLPQVPYMIDNLHLYENSSVCISEHVYAA